MLDAALDSNPMPGEKSELGRAAGKPFERRQAVSDRELPDGVHLRVKVEWRDAGARIADFGKSGRDLRS